ncbi:MAG: carbohydrate kinase family protein [Clostridiales Family XIII bacterium]|jgi:sugar/nucleoside kinase (ribokinase family)|nr:carbohydrate kinase family protein [Clostridiales Family XIII bacterium]
MNNKGSVIFAGNLIVDRLKFVEAWPPEMGLTTITRQMSGLGGLVCNCAIDMAKLAPEVPVKVLGMAGEDALGDLIMDELSKFPSIDTGLVTRAGETSFTDVITTPGGRRTFFQFRGAGALLGPEHFDFARCGAEILHIGYILLLDRLDGPDKDYPTGMCRVLDAAGKAGILTSVDMVSEAADRYRAVAAPALAYTDILTINDTEAEGVTGIRIRDAEGRLLDGALEACVRALAALGVKKWVCVHMPELAAGCDVASGEYMTAKSIALPEGFIKSSVGAGDAFAAGLLYAVRRGLTLAEALAEANIVAAYSLKGYGANDSMAPLAEIKAKMAAETERVKGL